MYNLLPGEGGRLEMTTELSPADPLGNLHIYLPTLHSLRLVCSKEEQVASLETMLQTDCNMYSVFSEMLSAKVL